MPDELAIAEVWLERERAAGVPNALFGPEQKRVSIEHWSLIVEKADQLAKPE